MRKQIVRVTGWCVLSVAFFLGSCDPFQEDAIPKENQLIINKNATDYYIMANTPAVIDLKSVVTSLFTSVTIKVSKDPDRGSLIFLSDFIFKYIPSPSFTAGEDQFVIEFVSTQAVQTTTITVHMTHNISDFPCSLYAVEDYSHGNPGKTVAIDFLNNDRICGIKTTDVTSSISVTPAHGQAVIKGDSIFYTSETDFEGIDEFVYAIMTGNHQQASAADTPLVSHGLIRISVTSEACPFVIFDSVALDLTDEKEDAPSAGECIGGYDIPVWKIAIPPCIHYGYYRKVISQSSQSGSVCSGADGSFAYHPDPDKTPKNETAKFEVCINAQCRQVTIYVIREESG